MITNTNNIQTRVYDPFNGCDLKMSADRLFTKQMPFVGNSYLFQGY